jgi:hypothetical protein
MALSSGEGEALLELGGESSVSKLTAEPVHAAGRTLAVRATTLDAFAGLQQGLRVTGIKSPGSSWIPKATNCRFCAAGRGPSGGISR